MVATRPLEEQRRPRQVKDRKSTRLNSSHGSTSYAVFCLKKKTYRQGRKSDQHLLRRVYEEGIEGSLNTRPNAATRTSRLPSLEPLEYDQGVDDSRSQLIA